MRSKEADETQLVEELLTGAGRRLDIAMPEHHPAERPGGSEVDEPVLLAQVTQPVAKRCELGI